MNSKWIGLVFFSNVVDGFILFFTVNHEIGPKSNPNMEGNDKESRNMMDKYDDIHIWGMCPAKSCNQRQKPFKMIHWILFIILIDYYN